MGGQRACVRTFSLANTFSNGVRAAVCLGREPGIRSRVFGTLGSSRCARCIRQPDRSHASRVRISSLDLKTL